MAKTIKFNLICDGYPVRTIEELQNHFSIEDVLDYYKNGLLQKWLRVRGFEKDYNIESLSKKGDYEVISALVSIFGVEINANKIKEGVYSYQYEKDRIKRIEELEKKKENQKSVVNAYFQEYYCLVDQILNNPKDEAVIKKSITDIANNYLSAFKLNHRDFFWKTIDVSPLAIMRLLMNETTRSFFMHQGFGFVLEDGTTSPDTDKNDMYESIIKKYITDAFKNDLGDSLHKVSKSGGMWEDIVPANKKCMVLSTPGNTQVRNYEEFGSEKKASEVINSFLIFNGLQYKCENSKGELLYMEV